MKKQSLKQIQNNIWQECKRVIKVRFGNDCYTCDAKNLTGSNRHTGHLIPKKYLPYQFKYDLRFLRPQCYNCNMNLGGMGALYLSNLLDEDEIEESEIWDFVYKVKEVKKIQKENKIKPKDVELFYRELLARLKLVTK
jgi:hypothetical protein